MKVVILFIFLVCALGTSIQASMMSEFNSVEEMVQSIVVNDMTFWLPEELEQRGGLNEEDIHNNMRAYLETGWPVTDEMLNSQDYVTRFDANKDGLVDKTEVIKLIKWFVRALYVGSEPAEKILSNSDRMQYLIGVALEYDENGDGMLDMNEIAEGMDELAFNLGVARNGYNTDYHEDYDTDSNGLLDKTELSELIKRFTRDLYS